MRHILGAVLILLAASASALMPPLKINYQGRLVDPTTSLPKTGPVTLTFKLYRTPDPADTSFYWSEVQSGVQLANGVFSVQLGSATLLHPDLLANTSAYLGIQVTGDASEMQPRQQLAMSPYAYSAVQLVSSSSIRVNAGVAYSTFTSGGSLDLQFGLDATTGVFTASGDTLYALQVSSGILMSSGTLRVAAGSHGIDAVGSGITASTGIFTGTGNTLYSVTTSSGLRVAGGTLDVQGNGGVEVLYGVKASTFVGSGLDLDDLRPSISSVSQNNLFTIGSGAGEVVLSSVTITPASTTSKVWITTQVGLNRLNNALTTWSLRIRRNTAGLCTIGSTQVGLTNTHTVPNTAGVSNLVFMQKVDAPGTTSAVSYCFTIQSNQATANTGDERNMVLMEVR